MRIIKSPELLASEQRARELSAIDLIAQGLISVPLSARQQAAYDDAVRYAAEVDERERAHYDQLPAQIAAENLRVVADLNEGRLYLANDIGDGGPMIHFASCSSVRHQIDRDVAHKFELDAADTVRGSWHSGPGTEVVAKWPNLITLDEVEQLDAYRACQRCNPDTKERRKRRARVPKQSKLSSVTPARIGRDYATASGALLGTLMSYTVTPDRIELHCTEQDYHGDYEAPVILLPHKTALVEDRLPKKAER